MFAIIHWYALDVRKAKYIELKEKIGLTLGLGKLNLFYLSIYGSLFSNCFDNLNMQSFLKSRKLLFFAKKITKIIYICMGTLPSPQNRMFVQYQKLLSLQYWKNYYGFLIFLLFYCSYDSYLIILIAINIINEMMVYCKDAAMAHTSDSLPYSTIFYDVIAYLIKHCVNKKSQVLNRWQQLNRFSGQFDLQYSFLFCFSWNLRVLESLSTIERLVSVRVTTEKSLSQWRRWIRERICDPGKKMTKLVFCWSLSWPQAKRHSLKVKPINPNRQGSKKKLGKKVGYSREESSGRQRKTIPRFNCRIKAMVLKDKRAPCKKISAKLAKPVILPAGKQSITVLPSSKPKVEGIQTRKKIRLKRRWNREDEDN